MTDELTDRQFRDEVFPQELDAIRQRRRNAGLPPSADQGTAPSLHHDLFGLALSGGGIRSASFSLGVLQALSASRLLSRVDYLSTVSGGGLIGAAVTSLLHSKGASAEPHEFPLAFDRGKRERPAIRYLRNHTRWLAPGGGLDNLRLPAILLRGMLNNIAVLLPLLMLAVLLTKLLFSLAYGVIGIDRVQRVPLAGAAAFVALALAQPVLYRLRARRFLGSWSWRDRSERLLALSLVLVVVVLVLIPVVLLAQQAIDLDWDDVSAWYAAHPTAVLAAAAACAIVLAVAVKNAFDGADRLAGKLSLMVIGIMGPVVVFAAYLGLTLIAVSSPPLSTPAESTNALTADLDDGEYVTPALQAAFHRVGLEVGENAYIESLGSGAYKRWKINADGWYCLVTRWHDSLRIVNLESFGKTDLVFLAIGAAGIVFAFVFSNPNVTGPHGFFRDRMSRAFLISVEHDVVKPRDRLRLSDLSGPDSIAPYHLLNATLNLQGARHLDLAGREADFFVFTPRYCGSATTGYCKTRELERTDRHLNVGTAMAISGAGLSPNEGTETIGPLVSLMTLLNLRLDYWLPNPRHVATASAFKRLRLSAVGPVYLLKEAFGSLTATGPFVNLSDGGHLENLGVYELLRRRCRWIVAIDASEDAPMTFPALMDVIRYARIDLGITIDVDVEEVRLIASGTLPASAKHFTVGTIDYGDNSVGHLVYVKASMTGDEPETIGHYRGMNPTFPQESSSNQAYTERQFEAYRALGEHIMADIIARDIGVDWPVEPAVQRPLVPQSEYT